DPTADLVESASTTTDFPVSSTSSAYYYFHLSSLQTSTSTVEVNWYRPDGTLETTTPITPVSQQAGDYVASLLPANWQVATGDWHVALVGDGVEIDRKSFNVNNGPGVPELRLTDGLGDYIINHRTTPIDYDYWGTNIIDFSVENHGNAPLNLSGLV